MALVPICLRFKTPLLRGFWQGRFPLVVFGAKQRFSAPQKPRNRTFWAFPNQACVDTYAPHPLAMPGSPSQEAFGTVRSAPWRWPGSFPARLWKARKRFNAGWSSPVARQAHNLKVIGSNPIPATKQASDARGFGKPPLSGGFLVCHIGIPNI